MDQKTRHAVLLLMLALVVHSEAANPGLKAIFSQSGLNYAASEAVQVLSTKVTGQPIADQSGTAHVVVGKVDYWLTGMRITSFSPPQSSLTIQPGRGVTWALRGASLHVVGNWRYQYKAGFIHIKDHGTFDVSAGGIGISISVTMGETGGKPTLKAIKCSSTIGDVSVKFHHGASWLYNLFKKYAEKALRNALQNTICSAATKAVNVDLAQKLADIPWVIPMGNVVDLDYSMVAPPNFQTSFLASFHKGEVYWIGKEAEAPFQPAAFPDVGQPQMLTLMVSDYLPNTMAYVLQQHGQIKHNLTKDELPDKDRSVLNTTCSKNVCIGTFLPQLAQMYPGLTVEVDMATSQAPTLNIAPAGLQGNFSGAVDYYVRLSNGSRAFLFSTAMNVTLDVIAYSQGPVIMANITKLDPEIKVVKSDIGQIFDSVLQMVFKIAADAFVLPKLNELGQKGLALPTVKDVRYVDPKLKLFQGALVLSTDLQYDPSTLYFKRSDTDAHRSRIRG